MATPRARAASRTDSPQRVHTLEPRRIDFDRAFERTGLFYVRFMDDIVVLAPTR